ncbi:MAG: peptidoglycan-binding protein [Clostridia bacterium]|nr:peptidoglycan-binding protein [Clostridia bacterium]
MTGTENKALYIAEQCRKAGMTLAGVAGILKNIEAESLFKSTNLEDSKEILLGMNDAQYTAAVDSGQYLRYTSDDAGYGLCQWTAGDRKDGMMKFHRRRGVSIGDFVTQVDWMLTEIKSYTRAWRTVTLSNDPYECGYVVCKYYEIPYDTENKAVSRGNDTQRWYDFLLAASQTGAESTITRETPPPVEPAIQAVDDEGIPIPQTWPPRVIDVHCSGWPEVWLLQAILKCRGFNTLIDGIWGSALTDKVKQFQEAHGLDADGAVGPMSWKRLGLSAEVFKK